MKSRLSKSKDIYDEEFNLSSEATVVLTDLHKKFTTSEKSIELPDSEMIAGMELTSDDIKSMTQKEFMEKIVMLLDVDACLVWKILEHQGIDLWLD